MAVTAKEITLKILADNTALEEGANIVRVGTAIFGERVYY